MSAWPTNNSNNRPPRETGFLDASNLLPGVCAGCARNFEPAMQEMTESLIDMRSALVRFYRAMDYMRKNLKPEAMVHKHRLEMYEMQKENSKLLDQVKKLREENRHLKELLGCQTHGQQADEPKK